MKLHRLVPLFFGFCFLMAGFTSAHAVRTVRVSVTSNGEAATTGDSYVPAMSDDGRYVVFESDASDLLGPGVDTNGVRDVFIHDRDVDGDGTFDESGAISTVRVSLDSDGISGNGDSFSPAISGDGRYVVFESDASNLLGPGVDTNGVSDIFVHDRDTDETARVNVSSAGVPASTGDSRAPVISDDGRYVVFESGASDLLGPGVDTNGVWDIFVHDRDTATTVRVNVRSDGVPASTGDSFAPAISGNGRYVVFESEASDLLDPGVDTNGVFDIFVHDRDTGQTTRVNVRSSGAPASTGDSRSPAVSDDGRYVAFESEASDLLVPGVDTNGVIDIFVHDRDTGSTVRVNVSSEGEPARGTNSHAPAVSASGRFVTFESIAGNLVPDDTSGRDIFLHDRDADEDGIFDEDGLGEIETTRVNLHSDGTPATGGASYNPAISDDGDEIVFASDANNLVDGDTSGRDIFVRVTTPTPTEDDEVTNGDGGGGGGCFVALIDDIGKKWLEILGSLL